MTTHSPKPSGADHGPNAATAQPALGIGHLGSGRGFAAKSLLARDLVEWASGHPRTFVVDDGGYDFVPFVDIARDARLDPFAVISDPFTIKSRGEVASEVERMRKQLHTSTSVANNPGRGDQR